MGSVEFTTPLWGLPLWESQAEDLPLTLPLQEEASWVSTGHKVGPRNKGATYD